jgi:2-polyprenyl-3-methyl-5-hydroxy-6-metoxy-1,4-benzoquinol methylase
MTEDKRQMFTERYKTQETPWDTNITPPEIVEVIAELPVGTALDLGCGTGTNVKYLLEHGWQVNGIDFVQQAIDSAKVKLKDFPQDQVAVFCYDVTQLEQLTDLRAPYDLVIDIGCGHGLDKDKNEKYAEDIAGLLKPDGVFMLYASQPRENSTVGWSPDDINRLFTPYFDMVWKSQGDDTSIGIPAGWYRLKRKA